MRYRAIQEHDRRVPVRLMCRALAVSPAGYDAWRARPESVRGAANRALVAKIRVIHRASRETDGSPSIWDALVKRGTVSASTASRGSCVPKGYGPRP